MADPVTTNIVLYFIGGMALVGSFKTMYDVWSILKNKCRPPEEREKWDGDARLMLEQIYTYVIESPRENQAIQDAIAHVSDVVSKEDSNGRRMIYFNETAIRSIGEMIKAKIDGLPRGQGAGHDPRRYVTSHTHSHGHSHRHRPDRDEEGSGSGGYSTYETSSSDSEVYAQDDVDDPIRCNVN